jgi:hypothetical protein
LRHSIAIVIAMALVLFAHTSAQAENPLDLRYYVEEVYVPSSGGVPAGFWNAFTYCANPEFQTGRPNVGVGSAFGMVTYGGDYSGTTVGFTRGEFGAATSQFTGTFVDNWNEGTGGGATETFYPISNSPPSGYSSFNEVTNTNTSYDNFYVNGSLVVSNVYEGPPLDGNHTSMWVGMWTQAGSQEVLYFPQLATGSAACSDMQIYGPTTGGAYETWLNDSDLQYGTNDPSGESTAYGSLEWSGSDPTFTFYSHS